jgi:hypothetical protein
MALTLIQHPKLHQPAHNPLNIEVSSNLSGNAGFRYFTEVFVKGSKRAEFFDIPRPNGGILWKDVHRVVEPFVLRGYGALTTGVQFGNNYADYQVKITEFSGSVSGAVYQTPVLIANNMAQSWKEYIQNDYDKYVFSPTGGVFRTNRTNIKIARSEVYSLSWITQLIDTTTNAVNRIQLIPFNSGGDLAAINFTDADQGDTDIRNAYKNIKIGFDFNSIPTNATGFRVVAQNQSNNNIGNPIVFNLTDECPRTDAIRVIYLNRAGGYDAYTFNANPVYTSQIERETFRRILGSVTNSGYQYTLSQHRELSLYTKYMENIQLRSQWLTDEESRAIEEMVTSPVAFWDLGGGTLLPINIQEDSYQRRYRAADRLFDAVVNIKVSFDNQTQRR